MSDLIILCIFSVFVRINIKILKTRFSAHIRYVSSDLLVFGVPTLLQFVPNLFLKQMLQNYNKPLPDDLPSTQDQIYVIKGITDTWNRVMIEVLNLVITYCKPTHLLSQEPHHALIHQQTLSVL